MLAMLMRRRRDAAMLRHYFTAGAHARYAIAAAGARSAIRCHMPYAKRRRAMRQALWSVLFICMPIKMRADMLRQERRRHIRCAAARCAPRRGERRCLPHMFSVIYVAVAEELLPPLSCR